MDVALLKLKTPIDCGRKLRPICLSEDESDGTENTTVIMAGWGNTEVLNSKNKESTTKEELKLIRVTVIGAENCGKSLEKTKTKLKSHICTVGNKEGPCKGDSGSPLFIEKNRLHYLIGIASAVYSPTCSPDYPTISTSLSSFMPWLKEMMKKCDT